MMKKKIAALLLLFFACFITLESYAEINQAESLQKLFEEFFPDCTYVDSYLQEDETVLFIIKCFQDFFTNFGR